MYCSTKREWKDDDFFFYFSERHDWHRRVPRAADVRVGHCIFERRQQVMQDDGFQPGGAILCVGQRHVGQDRAVRDLATRGRNEEAEGRLHAVLAPRYLFHDLGAVYRFVVFVEIFLARFCNEFMYGIIRNTLISFSATLTNPQGSPNLHIYTSKDGELVKNFVHKKQSDWWVRENISKSYRHVLLLRCEVSL